MLNLHYKIDDITQETRVLPLKKVYDFGRTRFCQYLIAENTEKGKFLAIDGRIQSSEWDYISYHESLLYYVPVTSDKKLALVLGAGEGVTGAMLSEKGYEVDQVDVDGVLIKAIQKYMSDWISWIDTPRKIVTYIYDAIDFLDHVVDEDKKYDVVVFDLNEPNVASEDCYSKELIEKIKNVLTDDGIFVYQNGSTYDKNPIMDELVGDVNFKAESISEIAEWKFKTVKFKEIKHDEKESNEKESDSEKDD